MSDQTGLELLLLVCLTQVLLAALLHAFVLKLVINDESGALMLIALSSSFFVFFWMADQQGSARKELLAFLAMALFVSGLIGRNAFPLVLGSVLFVASIAAHEGMIFFLPILAVAYLIARQSLKDWLLFHVIFALTIVLSVIVFFLALTQSQVSDHMVICQPLLDRGLVESICQGAISWLESDLVSELNYVASTTDLSSMIYLVIGYAIALLPLIYIAMISDNWKMAMSVAIAPLVVFLPLYFVAIDHGRWISFHVFSSFILFALALSANTRRDGDGLRIQRLRQHFQPMYDGNAGGGRQVELAADVGGGDASGRVGFQGGEFVVEQALR